MNINKERKLDVAFICDRYENSTIKQGNITTDYFKTFNDFIKYNDNKEYDILLYYVYAQYNIEKLNMLKEYLYNVSNTYNKVTTLAYWYIVKQHDEILYSSFKDSNEYNYECNPRCCFSIKDLYDEAINYHDEIKNNYSKQKRI